jgi:hypothetical protein
MPEITENAAILDTESFSKHLLNVLRISYQLLVSNYNMPCVQERFQMLPSPHETTSMPLTLELSVGRKTDRIIVYEIPTWR